MLFVSFIPVICFIYPMMNKLIAVVLNLNINYLPKYNKKTTETLDSYDIKQICV